MPYTLSTEKHFTNYKQERLHIYFYLQMHHPFFLSVFFFVLFCDRLQAGLLLLWFIIGWPIYYKSCSCQFKKKFESCKITNLAKLFEMVTIYVAKLHYIWDCYWYCVYPYIFILYLFCFKFY